MHEESRDPTIHKKKEIEPSNDRMRRTRFDGPGSNLLHQQEMRTFEIHNTCVNEEPVQTTAECLNPCQSQNQHLNPWKTDTESDRLDLILVLTTGSHYIVLLEVLHRTTNSGCSLKPKSQPCTMEVQTCPIEVYEHRTPKSDRVDLIRRKGYTSHS